MSARLLKTALQAKLREKCTQAGDSLEWSRFHKLCFWLMFAHVCTLQFKVMQNSRTHDAETNSVESGALGSKRLLNACELNLHMFHILRHILPPEGPETVFMRATQREAHPGVL